MIGESTSVDFWHDNWLKVSLADWLLLSIAQKKVLGASVCQFLHSCAWNLPEYFFIVFPNLADFINSIRVFKFDSDVVLWKSSPDGILWCFGKRRFGSGVFHLLDRSYVGIRCMIENKLRTFSM